MRGWIAVGLSACVAACVPGFGARRDAPSALEQLPVLLVLDGDRPSAAETKRIATALSHRIERPVVTADASSIDPDQLARRLAARWGRAPRGPWDAERCAVGQAAAHALAHEANAHYRIVLRRRTSTRTITAEERRDASVTERTAARLLGRADQAQETRIDGEVIATTFGREPAATRVPIHAADVRLGATGDGTLDVVDVVAQAIQPLRPPAYPLWDGLARRLLARGCSLAALAVYDARLQHRADSRDVLRAALGPDPTRAAPAVVAAPAPTTPPDEAPVAPAPTVSCTALCEAHMVELCNNDRELWNRHRADWVPTPCGQMRLEPFLRECYQRQWLSGTLQEACVGPCERTDEGRARLLHLLRSQGCARRAPS